MATGYYYSIAFNPSQTSDHAAQFSYPFYSTCSDSKLQEKLNDYVQANSFETGRNEGPFNSQNEADNDKITAKKNFEDSGYVISSDNNFFGDCS